MSLKKVNNNWESTPQGAALFHLFIENNKDYAIFMTDAEGRVISWNPGVERLLGYRESEIIGQSIAIIFTPEDVAADAPAKELERAAQTGCSEDKRWHLRKDGSLFWANGMAMPLKNEDGTLRGFAKVMRDDTEQKQTEEKLEQTNLRIERILSSISDSFYRFDREFRYVYVNEATTKMFGLTETEFLGKTLWEVFPDVEGNLFHAEVLRAFNEQRAVVFENYYPPYNRWFENRAYPSPEGMSVFTSEITERKRAEELRLERERLAILNSELSLALVQSNSLPEILQSCTETIVKHLDAAFARIWTLDEKEKVLELQASAGIYTHLDGAHSRVPVGKYKIGLIAKERKPHLTNSVIGDSRVSDQKWAKREGMVAFAGYPLIIGERLVGVVAMFARHTLGLDGLEAIEAAARIIALGIEGKHAEENLKHQKTLLEALTESVLDGILIVSTEGRLLHFNRHFLKIWNFPPDVIKSQSDEAALRWAAEQTMNPAAFLARVSTVYEQPEREVREEIMMKDGRVFERFGAPIFSGETRLGWVWTFRDITDRKRAETNLAFLAEISQDLTGLSSSDDITQAMTGKIGKYFGASNCLFAEIHTAANTATVNYCWCRDETVIDLTGSYQLSEFVSDEFRNTLIARKPVVVEDVETDSRTAENAARFHALKIGSFINTPFVSDGILKFVLGVYHTEPYEWRADEVELLGELITRVWTRIERARTEENLRESEEQLRALAGSIPQLTWMAEPDGFIFWYNRRWYEYTGTTPEEMEGWGWQSVHDAEMLPRVMERWQASIQTGEPFEMEFPLRRGTDGAFRWFLTRVVPLHDLSGRIVRWFGTNTDIEELRQARLQAEQANRLKDEFLATLSHEIRTPLNAILGWSQMLQTQNLSESETKKALTTIERNARAQNQLIDDLLDVSRIVTGKLRLNIRAVDLTSVITAAVDAVRPAADAKNIRLQILLDPQAGPISGDPDRLQQVVWNLLSNAVKFTPKNGRVQTRLEQVNSHVEIVISDTGKGIEPEFLPHVFDRFRQSDGSMTRREGGLGLGLAIVRQLVELHGGTVSVSSAGEDEGATFIVSLPLLPLRQEPVSGVPRLHPKAETGASPDCPPELSDLRVLLVDDEADSRDLIKLVLDSCGATVTIASSASEAFETIKREKFDVIVSDIGMPDEDGFSLIRKIRELPVEQGGDVPAIALTAYARAEDRVRALRSGFQMHVAKPVESVELITIVANLAGRMGNSYRNKNG